MDFGRGVDLYLHTFVLWASDWGRIEQTLHSRRSPPETEVFLSLWILEDIHMVIIMKIISQLSQIGY
jgi:hypothetical protein